MVCDCGPSETCLFRAIWFSGITQHFWIYLNMEYRLECLWTVMYRATLLTPPSVCSRLPAYAHATSPSVCARLPASVHATSPSVCSRLPWWAVLHVTLLFKNESDISFNLCVSSFRMISSFRIYFSTIVLGWDLTNQSKLLRSCRADQLT